MFPNVEVVRLDSLDSDALRDYRELTDVVLRRLSEPAGGLYIAESSKVIERALAAGHRPGSVLTIEKWLPDLERILAEHLSEAELEAVPIYVGDTAMLESLTGF